MRICLRRLIRVGVNASAALRASARRRDETGSIRPAQCAHATICCCCCCCCCCCSYFSSRRGRTSRSCCCCYRVRACVHARVRVRGDAKGRAWGGLGSGVGHAGLQETWKEALHLVFNKSGFKPAIFTSHSKASAPAGCQAAAA